MRLSDDQVRQFDADGYLFLPDCFSPEEVAALKHETDAIYASGRTEAAK